MIRDQFVEGCVSSRLRDRLCVEDQLTLQRLESIALAEDRAVDRQRLFGEGGGASRRDHPASPVSPPVEVALATRKTSSAPPTTSRLQAFGGSRLAVAGVIAVTVETEDGRSCQSSLYVADGSTALLGRDLQRSLHISVKDGSVVCAHVKGSINPADGLSRLPAPVEVVSEDEQLVVAALSEETAAVSADELKAESRADHVLGKLRDQIPQLLHGRPMRGKLSAAVDVGGRLPERPGELHSRVEKKQAYQKRYFDKTHRVKKPDFEIGDRVRHRLPPQSRKGRPRFSRVKKVLERRGPASYVLDDGTRVHADRLTSGGGAVTDSRDEQPQQRIDNQPEQREAGETAVDGRQTERGHAETNSELPQPEQPATPDADQPLSPTLRTRYGREVRRPVRYGFDE
ncbi:hypothetical protein FJT64_012124 [Amphibalanus amphitrite]|uniref:Uncharacterized protein n=1 Tax=Amphibalanus amphitrite TaxID=1232801 RepID=A0A6A4VDR2_AMPAM|nr:hypothetical protein FJT64_012124 [Amphibalanus amphitrite]